MDEYLTLYDGEDNRRRLSAWEPEVCARDQWHGRTPENSFRETGHVPITIDIQHPLWLKVFPQDLSQTFTNAADYLKFYLQKRVTQFKEFQDDTPLEPIIPMWMHTPFEMSLFGLPVHYFSDKDPLIDMNASACQSREELDRMPPVDFYRSGLMPLTHRIYEGILGMTGSRFKVLFPEWTRGPFGVSLYLGGYTNMLLNMAQDPEFFDAVMDRVTEERKKYFQARQELMNEAEIPPGSLFNDEVDTGVIGPAHYRDFIKPYERQLGRFHGRISYWHSCGNIWSIAPEVADTGYVDVLDISGYTDHEKALRLIGDKVPRIDLRLHPIQDLQNAPEDRMEQRLKQILGLCNENHVAAVSLRVSGLNPWLSLEEDFEKIRRWIRIARRVIDDNIRQKGFAG